MSRLGEWKFFLLEAACQETWVQEAGQAVQRGESQENMFGLISFRPAGNRPDEVWAWGGEGAEEPEDPAGGEDAGPADPQDEGGVQPALRQLRPAARDDAQGERAAL